MLGERLTNLLSLLSQDEFRSADRLAEEMKLSSRTLRSLIKELDEKLANNGARVIQKRGEGFMLEVNDLDAFGRLFAGRTQRIPSDSSERVHFIIEQFLKSSDYIKMEEMCDAIFVSRKTLAADMKKAEEFFEEFHLKIERKPHYGMRLVGEEFQKRLCMARYLHMKNGRNAGAGLGADEEQRRIADCVLEALETEEYHISDVGFDSLILHIGVSIARIRENQYISLQEEEYKQLIGENEYRLAKKCVTRIEKELGIVFPEEEIRYISIHFAGKESNRNLVISSDVHTAVMEMLAEINDVFQIDFRDDLELVMSLGLHLMPLVIRLKYGMRLTNPLLSEVKKRYSLAYTMAVQGSAVLERRYQAILDSNEIAYIALVFALALERQKHSVEKKRVLFVCASGAATARLMAYNMQQNFGDYIGEIIVCDQLGIGRQDFSQIDYLFTTVPIHEEVPVPICEVKQLMAREDVSSIRQILSSGEQDIMTYYPENLFFAGVEGRTKEEVLKEICDRISQVRELPKGFYQAVLKREKLARTCMGNRVAMPHPCKVMTEDTFVSVGILKQPVQWDENQEVQAVFLVSVSRKKNKKIQHFYSTTARLLLNGESIDTLIRGRSYETLQTLLTNTEREWAK